MLLVALPTVLAPLALPQTAPAPFLPRRSVELATPHEYNELHLGDANGDGMLDLVAVKTTTVLPGNHHVELWLGDGAGSFQQHFDHALSIPPVGLLTADVTGDGVLDLVFLTGTTVWTGLQAEVHVLVGDGTGLYPTELVSPTGSFTGDRLELGELDGDGELDLLVTRTYATPIPQGNDFVPMLRTGPGLFSPGAAFDLPMVPASFVNDALLEDFDGDGDADLLALRAGELHVLENHGGTFAGGAAFALPGATLDQELVRGSFLQAGSPTLVAVREADVQLLALDAAGNVSLLGPPVAHPQGVLDLWRATVRPFDIEGDGVEELGILTDGDGRLTVLRATGAGRVVATSGASQGWCSGDVDGDGRADHVFADRFSETLYTALGGPESGGLGLPGAWVPCGVDAPDLDGLAVGDFDGDGANDLALVGWALVGDLFLWSAGGSPAPLDAGTLPKLVDRVDADGDGITDLALAPSGAAPVRILLGDGAGGFGAPLDALDSICCSVDPRWFDADADGDLDLVVGRSGLELIALYRGAGDGGLEPWDATSGWFDTTLRVFGLDASDLDGDGAVDLVVGGGWQTGYEVLLGDGSGGFVSQGVAPTSGREVWDVLALDLDADGVRDLVLGLDDGLMLLDGDGLGGFTVAAELGVSGDVLETHLTDVDADGWPDLIAFATPGRAHVLLGGAQGFGPARTYAMGAVEHVRRVADFDGDGRNDLLGPRERAVVLQLGLDAAQPGVTTFGSGTGGCRGRLGVSAGSPASVGNAGFGLTCTNGPRLASGLFALGFAPAPAGTELFGLAVHVGFAPPPVLLPARTDAGGTGWVVLPLPADPGLVGKQAYGQFLWPPGPEAPCFPTPIGFTTSVGVELTFQP